jgi:PAS domain S-box-containing protein
MSSRKHKTLAYTALFVFVFGIISLTGWILNIEILKSIIPGYVTMKFNTAICFILCSVALWFLIGNNSNGNTIIIKALMLVVVLLGGSALFQDVLQLELAIDQFFFKDYEAIKQGHPAPGRMAASTSLSFILIGVSVFCLLAVNNTRKQVGQWLLHFTTFLALTSLIGYLFQLPVLYKPVFFTSMAVHTAIGLAALSIAFVSINDTLGIPALFSGNQIGNVMARALFPQLAMISLVLGFVIIQSYRLNFIVAEFGISLFVISFILVGLFLIRSNARMLNNLDVKRINAENVIVSLSEYRALVEEAGDLIYEVNNAGLYIYVNPATESVTGYSQKELMSMNYLDLIHPDFKEKVNQFYKNQLKGRVELSDYEMPVVTKSGETIWLSQRVRMIFNGGWLEKIKVVSHDITELYNFRQALLASESRFKSLSENSPVGIYELDAEGNTIFINKRWFEITGLDPALDNSREARINAIHPEDRERVLAAWNESFKKVNVIALEFRYLTPKKGVTWILSKTSRVLKSDGTLQGFIGIANDITQLKLAEQKLAESEKNYRLISENSSDIIAIHGLDGKLIYISPSVKELLGYETEELIGKSDIDLVYQEDQARINESKKRLTADEGGIKEHIEFRLLRKDGSFVWVEVVAKTVLDSNGRLLGLQTSARDITQRKIYEYALRSEKEKAEKANVAKSLFLSSMSHEIRTPMNAVVGLTNFLLDENPRADQLESLKLLKFSGENLLVIINDILDFSKIEAEKIEFEKIPFDLHNLLNNAIQMVMHRAIDKGVTLSLNCDESVPIAVMGDPVRIAQIINNLIGNAIKFTEHGYVQLNVKRKAKNDKSVQISFLVKDTGIGIAQEKQESIFNRFSQASADTTRKFGGTGLGLAITRKLINLMGSDITVKSKLGEGSEFEFVLTLETSEVTELNKEELTNENYRAEGVKVLLVDDNHVNLVVAKNYLNKWGFEVTMAKNGLEAVQLVQQEKFQLILMDLQMPEMDGYQATRLIRSMSEPYFKTLPILALTASAMVDSEKLILEAGMNDVITKPFKTEDFRNIIFKYLATMDVSITPSSTV